MNLPRRLVFMGTAELAGASLEALAQNPSWQVAGVITQPDRPRGRDLQIRPTPVKQVALKLGLPVYQPERLRSESSLQLLRDLNPELIVVAAYGQILPPAVLDLPRQGCLNVHTSLLPKYRGAAPIQWALLNGDAETGVTIMRMDAGLDTGDILTQQATPILPADNAETLHDRLARLGADLLLRTLPDYLAGQLIGRAQVHTEATYARKITKEDGLIDWSLTASAIGNRLRAFTPWPGAFTFLPAQPQPLLLKIWKAQTVAGKSGLPGQILEASAARLLVACGQDALQVLSLQREGRKRLETPEFLQGTPLEAGQRLSTPPPG